MQGLRWQMNCAVQAWQSERLFLSQPVLLSTRLPHCHAQGFEAFRKEHAAVLEASSLAAEDVLAKARIMALLVLGARREEISFATIQARRLAAAVLHAPACSYRPIVLGTQAVPYPLFSIDSCTAHLPCAWDTVQRLLHGGWLPCMPLHFGCSAHICRGMLGVCWT